MNHLSRPLCPHAQFSSKAWQDMPPASPCLDVCQFLSILCKMLGLLWNAGQCGLIRQAEWPGEPILKSMCLIMLALPTLGQCCGQLQQPGGLE